MLDPSSIKEILERGRKTRKRVVLVAAATARAGRAVFAAKSLRTRLLISSTSERIYSSKKPKTRECSRYAPTH